ncbi:MAG: hypothetical protein COC15_00440 [Legionellales bacterium]|nr:MAG: hypothetical protein COC15_00440 [Legionellales bacterium]
MFKKIIITSLVIGSIFNVALAKDTSNVDKLVSKITKGNAVVQKTFRATNELTGLVLQDKKSGESVIAYTNKDAGYLVFGNILTKDGVNLSQKFSQKYLNSMVAKQAYSELKTTTWFSQGSDKAKHKAYILMDPNCIFCHRLYDRVQSLIKKGELQVRWILVGFLKPSSAGISAHILSGKTAQEKVKLLAQNEKEFQDNSEQGGITPLDEKKSDILTASIFANVKKNTNFFMKHAKSFIGTPTTLYRTKDGSPTFQKGALPGKLLDDAIADMSSNW